MKRLLLVALLSATPLFAQAQPAPAPAEPASAPAPFTPSFKVGALLFADYTYTADVNPPAVDADGNTYHPSSFNVSRAYINIFGQLTPWLSFRITPDIARETGSGSSLSGSQDYRLKFGYAQFALDRWIGKGSWIRAGVTETPFIPYEEGVYRYRFQGPVFVDREGLLFASDGGVAFHYEMPSNHGDVHAGFYNGEGYAKSEQNNEKAFQIRATWRPMPENATLKGLRLTGFVDEDHYVQSAPRRRFIEQVTFEHPLVNAGLDVVQARDQKSETAAQIDGDGYSIWATPKFGHGWEALLRHDELKPNNDVGDKKKRDIEGVAYWFPTVASVQSAVMLDRDAVRGPASGVKTTNWGVKLLISF